ncbi:DegT/DnrJ/EryC1/StrS family aminotransferase [Haloarchaeobius salinus]|uniref:DegT/DnrJ/EryC1/StrS family aminotransferase n=1 Tax=Haloarchaeobius salinus TaxID=1198298 RepID=UPI0021094382|nr:DegT/DnrJ/EryC1/StrS family aminotransferase [Haloarchaeobius salinus]
MIELVEPVVGDAEHDRIASVLADGQLADGSTVRSFEDRFADYCGTDHAVATSNGTTALHAALVACGVGDGDTVVTSPFTFVATANAIRHVGAEPVFVDVDPTTFTIDVDAVAKIVRRQDVDALVPVHLFGLPADMPRLRELAAEYDFALVEDACQAHGASIDGELVGSLGDAGCFSFYPSKNMTTGEGGMVTTDDDEVAARIRRFVDHGRDGTGRFVETGHNFRMTSIAAGIGLEQLRRLPEFNNRRRANAETLTERLAGLPIRTPGTPDDRRHVFNQYTVLTERREALADHLECRGVDSGVYYPTPVHREPSFSAVDADCRVADRLADEVLSLPVHPALDDREVRAVAEAVRGFYRE